jgi:hypothetical protein
MSEVSDAYVSSGVSTYDEQSSTRDSESKTRGLLFVLIR